jgi:hypothetical protein
MGANRKIRAMLTTAVIMTCLGTAPGRTTATVAPAVAAVTGTPNVTADAATRGWLPVVPTPPIGPDEEATATSARCSDPAGTWMGMWWRSPVQWRINDSTIPAYLTDRAAVVAAIRSAATTVDTGRNDCGLPPALGLSESFLGGTGRTAEVTSTGGCGQRDGQSTVSFGRLNPGLLAVTCVWWYDDPAGGRSAEADILIDDTPGLFFLTTPPGCTGQWDLEGTITHEFGHVFGLGHVSFPEHQDLTMTAGLPDCSTAYRGLGLGDYEMLKAHYGA